MATIDPAAAAANAQALADSYAQAVTENSFPVSSGADHAAEDESKTNKRKFDGIADEEEDVKKRPNYNGLETNGVGAAACL